MQGDDDDDHEDAPGGIAIPPVLRQPGCSGRVTRVFPSGARLLVRMVRGQAHGRATYVLPISALRQHGDHDGSEDDQVSESGNGDRPIVRRSHRIRRATRRAPSTLITPQNRSTPWLYASST